MLDKLKEKLAQKTQNVVSFIKVPDDIREQRLEICMSCDKLIHKIDMCKLCGCLVHAKTWVAQTSCPIKKWDKHEV